VLELTLNKRPVSPLKVLCIGAHSDDIEIGCGGTVLRLAQDHDNMEVLWVVLSSGSGRDREARASARMFLRGVRRKTVVVKDFRNGFFPYVGCEIKEFFERLKSEIDPDVVFTHYRNDLHQDHRVACELTWNTFRNHLILEYEVPKYDGDLGAPGFFVPLTEALCRRKVRYLLSAFATQSDKHWFAAETFMGLMRLRGVEAAAREKFAEAFYCRKVVLGSML